MRPDSPSHPLLRARSLGLAAVLLLAALSTAPAAGRGGSGGDGGGGNGGGGTMALRVNDARGGPGGTVAVVLRTYAPRPIGQGQICLRGRRRPAAAVAGGPLAGTGPQAVAAGAATTGGNPFVTLLGAKVFGPQNDVQWTSSYENGEVLVTFRSPSGTINTADGPMVVLYLRLARDLAVGQRFDLTVDLDETALFDERGRPITVDPRPGRLEIRPPGALYQVRASGAKIRPGQLAKLGLETQEPAALRRGKIGLRYDKTVLAGVPGVRIDGRFGHASFLVDRRKPGLVIVEFESADASLNGVPGKIIEIRVPTSPRVPHGKKTRVWLDPNLTYLVGRNGDLLPLRLADGRLEFK